MTLEEEILAKIVEIGAKRVEIEDLERDIGLVAAREGLALLLDELNELYRLHTIGGT
jgi:hypothetical protein